MNKKTIFFVGPPGSGKGTQAKLIVESLRSRSEESVLHVEMGASFRRVAGLETPTGVAVREAMQSGEVLPAFLAISFWADELSRELTPDQHLVLDGSPRSQAEAEHLAAAVRFYDRAPATMIHLPISEEETRRRLADRHRGDDEASIVDTRLAEYREKTQPAIEFSKKSDAYNLITVDGEQSIEAIQEDLQKILTDD